MGKATNTAIRHLSCWIAYACITIFVYGYEIGYVKAMPETLASYSIAAAVFYMHIFSLSRIIDKRKYLLYSAALFCILLINFISKYFIFNHLFPQVFNLPSYTTKIPITNQILVFSYQTVIFLVASAGYWMATKMLRSEKDGRKRDQEAAEKDRLQLENAALRAQINPHFFINTMEYLRVESEIELPEVAEGIEALMTFIRSSIAETDEEGKIPLFDEIEAIESLILIFKRRFPEANIEYKNEITRDVQIVPHVLTAFVENAFKHGSFTSEENKLYILLTQSDEDLKFTVYNKKSRRLKDSSRGIGIRYIKSQLAKSYPGMHNLQVLNGDYDYQISLTINNILHADKLLHTRR